jgi:hypothetical protein
VNGKCRRIDEKRWIQGIFKNESRRFTIDSGTTGLTSSWAGCATVAPPGRTAE